MIEAADLKIVEGDDRRLISEDGALKQLDDFWEIIEAVDSQIPSRDDIDYQSFLDRANASPLQIQIAKSFVEGFNAAHADVISTSALKFEEEASEKIEGTRQFRLADGYDGIVPHLARDLPRDSVRLGCVVRTVNWQSGRVRICAEADGKEVQFHGSRLVLTLPLGVLRASLHGPGAVIFDPPLDIKREPVTHLEVGHVVKIVMQFRETFWQLRTNAGAGAGFGFALCLEAEFPTWWTQSPASSNLLTGWAGGPAADKLADCNRKEIRAAAFDSISRAFGVSTDQLDSLFIRDWYHDWATDPFALGAYSYPKVGGVDAAKRLAEPIAKTLFFAGEATDILGFNGTVHGAIESGLRVAREILG